MKSSQNLNYLASVSPEIISTSRFSVDFRGNRGEIRTQSLKSSILTSGNIPVQSQQ